MSLFMRIFSIPLTWFFLFTATNLQVFSDKNQTLAFDIEGYPYSPLSLSNRIHDLNLSQPSSGVYQIKTTGNDPYVWLEPFKDVYQPVLSYVIAFEYQVSEDFGDFVFYCQKGDKTKAIRTELKPSEQWKWHVFELSEKGNLIGQDIDAIRMDFGEQTNKLSKLGTCGSLKQIGICDYMPL